MESPNEVIEYGKSDMDWGVSLPNLFPRQVNRVDRSRRREREILKRVDNQKSVNGVIKPEAEILDGNNADTLKDGIRIYEAPYGTIYAATDAGVDYDAPNNDRVGVSAADNYAIVADGMGHSIESGIAAHLMVRSGLAFPDKPQSAINAGNMLIRESGLNKGSTCFASVQIAEEKGQKQAVIAKAGDVKVLVLDGSKIQYESTDDSFVQHLVDINQISPDQALYHTYRNIVLSYVSGNTKPIIKPDIVKVKKGNIVLIMSDGISDNLTPEEIAMLIKGKDGKGIIDVISDTTDKRMLLAYNILGNIRAKVMRIHKGAYTDGFKTEPKPDNRGIAVIEIK